MKHPVTLDGRYFVVRSRLWRMANPGLGEVKQADLVGRLMGARRAVRKAKKAADLEAEATAPRTVDELKQALGGRGAVWWSDGSPDINRPMAKNTHYANGGADAVAIGDTPYDAEAAGKAGVRTVGVLCGRFTEDKLGKPGVPRCIRGLLRY